MATLTSVNKEHLDNILDGIKTIEWRKKPLPLGKHYGYETKNKGGCGKVTGEFEIVDSIKFNLHGDTYRPQWLAKGCVPFEFLVKYANGAEYLYANIIENAKRYDKPKDLSEFMKYVKDYYCDISCKHLTKKGKPLSACDRYCDKYKTYLAYYDSFLRCVECLENEWFIKRPPQSYMFVEDLEDLV